MSNKTIYDCEPNYDDYDRHEQCLIEVIYGFTSPLIISTELIPDARFVKEYCGKRNLNIPPGF